MGEYDRATLEKAVRGKAYVSFVDVLGYGSVLSGNQYRDDVSRLVHLLDIWENLGTSIEDAQEEKLPIDAILFSDSMYISSNDIVPIGVHLARIYVCAFHYYSGCPEKWMPWLRAGVSYDWMLDFKDPTLAALLKESNRIYRNPSGPALQKAYQNGEKSGFKGMRILIPKDIKERFWMEARYAVFQNPTVSLYSKLLTPGDWPIAGQCKGDTLYDLPWWWCINDGMDPRIIWREHAWQVGYGDTAKATEHYEETLRLLGINPGMDR